MSRLLRSQDSYGKQPGNAENISGNSVGAVNKWV
jgi:hypothetical protein